MSNKQNKLQTRTRNESWHHKQGLKLNKRTYRKLNLNRKLNRAWQDTDVGQSETCDQFTWHAEADGNVVLSCRGANVYHMKTVQFLMTKACRLPKSCLINRQSAGSIWVNKKKESRCMRLVVQRVLSHMSRDASQNPRGINTARLVKLLLSHARTHTHRVRNRRRLPKCVWNFCPSALALLPPLPPSCWLDRSDGEIKVG